MPKPELISGIRIIGAFASNFIKIEHLLFV